jgi:hypothetical protein
MSNLGSIPRIVTMLAGIVPGQWRLFSAIRIFDSDLSDALHISRPAELSFVAAEPYSLGYDIVHTFSRLGPDNARIAGDELMDSYSWAKQ